MSNYLEDKDLEFLKDCANEDLKALADLLVFDKDGKKRWNEKLSGKKSYMENYPNTLKNAVDDIILELQCYGADTIAAAVRELFGKHPGVPYREILKDVCDKKKVRYNKEASTCSEPSSQSALERRMPMPRKAAYGQWRTICSTPFPIGTSRARGHRGSLQSA